jgi:hypothetical protein
MKRKIYIIFSILTLAIITTYFGFQHFNQPKQEPEMVLDFGEEGTEMRRMETKNLSPYAIFGDSSVVLMTEAEEKGINYLRIPNIDKNSEMSELIFELHTGKVICLDKKGNTLFTSFLSPTDMARFLSVDPIAHKREWLNPYNFVQNNPILRIDPLGLTDFKFNEKTGQLSQVGDKNDKPDRILQADKNGNVKKKGEGFLGFLVRESKRGEAKVAIGNIEQGILKDGMNLKNNSNVIQVGGEGQATEKGFQDFALKFSNYIGKEIGGYYLANKSDGKINNIFLGGYKNNDAQNDNSTFDLAKTNPALFGSTFAHTSFHTHLSRFGDSDRLEPSGRHNNRQTGDLRHKDQQIKNGVQRFIIITNPNIVDYTDY